MGWCDRVIGGRACRAALLAAVLAAMPGLAGCGLFSGPKTANQDAQQNMTVTSPVFGQGVIIPAEYTCHGRDGGISPPLYWSGAPAGTKSLALVVDDADAPITPYIYWIVFDISPATTDIQAGHLSGGQQANNSRGFDRYDAPCPTHGSHEYRFTIYALSSVLRLANGVSAKAAWMAIARSAIARGRLTATARQ